MIVVNCVCVRLARLVCMYTSDTILCQSLLHINFVIVLGEKFLQNFTSSRDGSEKVQKQGRDERTHEDYSKSAKNTLQLACHVFSLLCFRTFLVHPFLK